MQYWRKNSGFTLVELLLVMGIMAVLFSIGTIGFIGSQGRNSLAQGVDILVADLRSQQTKAMTGVTLGGVEQAGYGVHFETETYTLFVGNTYDPASLSNSVVELPTGVSVSSNNFVGGQVVFLRSSGEVDGYSMGQDSVVLSSESSGETRTVKVNELGVVVEGI